MSGLVMLALVTVLYALLASRLDRWSIGAPIVFVTAGAILGPAVLGWLDVPSHAEPVKLVTEFTLALLLFADASTVGVHRLKGDALVPTRLLLVGLPLTIVLGTVLAHWIVADVGWAMAALIATILTPTDAALSIPVVSNPVVPARVRRALSVESGLNDGIAAPIVVVMIAVVAGTELPSETDAPGAFHAIAMALLVAVIVGVIGGFLVNLVKQRGALSTTSERLVVITLAVLSYVAAVDVGGNGFVSAFAAGLCFGTASRHCVEQATEFTETTGMFASFIVWALFGATLVGPLLTMSWNWEPVAFAALTLTVGRMLPVLVSMAGSRLRLSTITFIGWFGPRGLASVVFLLIATEQLELEQLTDPLVETVVWTVALSVAAHGLTAGPLSRLYGHAILMARPEPSELAPGAEPRPRKRGVGDHGSEVRAQVATRAQP